MCISHRKCELSYRKCEFLIENEIFAENSQITGNFQQQLSFFMQIVDSARKVLFFGEISSATSNVKSILRLALYPLIPEKTTADTSSNERNVNNKPTSHFGNKISLYFFVFCLFAETISSLQQLF